MWSSDLFLHPAVSRVSHSPGFSESGSMVWVQVLKIAKKYEYEFFEYYALLFFLEAV